MIFLSDLSLGEIVYEDFLWNDLDDSNSEYIEKSAKFYPFVNYKVDDIRHYRCKK